MPSKKCDNTSVGIITFVDGALLLIDRAKPPFGLAAPAGHVDDHGNPDDSQERRFGAAAREELQEETGLIVTKLMLIGKGVKENPCRREGGSWHYWQIYLAETEGEIRPSEEETKGYRLFTKEETKQLLAGGTFEMAHGEVSLEPVWQDWFMELKILNWFRP
ncbi:NUDIX hydrolase [Candidatus Parcubacteria bacterium]|uniref:NUDIX hydrolase n=1 Tax=Candidatus Kaiserbacteria bacterium CG10_big_fil_rev_8_21_14_0_10_47_16 TaxID=1974608 RepID=A0A2H0UE11_9BACT|nr:NUDIX hydrolase [Candidatus Parcubacteria bacterium]PIR84631.1 MAG: NUDIX hydrolase [Candidatus Kaiserbacteria bacterium CG10_big_fil_rev_8_21_14_0_10_47_16]